MTSTLRLVKVDEPRTAQPAVLDTRLDTIVVWGVFGLFVVAQLVRLASTPVGPSLDEGIYLTSGMRTLEGRALQDGYMTWFAGSLLWPIVGAVGHHLAGLFGARLVALTLVGLGLWGALQATANLYGRRARRWATPLILGWGPVLSVSRIAEYDAVAIAGVGLCLWALTHFARRDHRLWLVLGAVAFAFGVVGKYAAAFTFPCVVGLLLGTRGTRRWADISIFVAIVGALLLVFFLPFREQLAVFPQWRVENNPSFGATNVTIAFTLIVSAVVPTLLAFVGFASVRTWDRWVSASLLSSSLLFPGYHFLAGNTVGATKHVVLGMLLATPLVGTALDRLTARPRQAAVVVAALLLFAALGWSHSILIERSWPDVRPTVAYLQEHVEPGETVANNGSWPYALGLYSNGNLDVLDDHQDPYGVENEPLLDDICNYDWFVNQQAANDWPGHVLADFANCPNFELMRTSAVEVTNLGTDLDYVTYAVRTDVWRNRR